MENRLKTLIDQVRVNAPAGMLRFEGLLEKILYLGVHPEIGLDADALDGIPEGELRKMAEDLASAGRKCTVHGPFMDLAPGAVDKVILEATRNRLARALELAALFEAEHIVFHPCYEEHRYGHNPEKWLEISLETWRPLARRSRELGIRFVLENTYEADPAMIEALVSSLAAEGCGFCFDAGHANAFGQAEPLTWLESMGPHLQAMHLHDNFGHRDDHLPLGAGNIDFGSIFKWLVEHDLRPAVVVLEPHREEDLMPSLAALEELWPWEL